MNLTHKIRRISASGTAILLTLSLGLAGCTRAQTEPDDAVRPDSRPNILLIVADDLGYSDLGAFGGEISTPNLDKLANGGVRFAQFYTAATCSPTRSMLMTGVDHHIAGLGSMAEMLTPEQQGHPGYEGYLNGRAIPIAERLQHAGYRTLMSGKWHLGLTPETSPAARGFETSFALLPGGAGHFDYFGLNSRAPEAPFSENGAPVTAPKDAYSSDLFADKLISQLPAGGDDGRPFFAYLAFTAPHWPLQAPREDIERYKGRYDGGWETLRLERLQRQRELGLLPPSLPIEADPESQQAWDGLTVAERQIAAREMEVYAAMVDRMDQNVGRVLEALQAAGKLDNTIILFLADNGPEGHELADLGIQDWVAENFDNSLENIGAANSYVMYGPRWASAATGGAKLFKGFPTEGGVRVAAFAWASNLAHSGEVSWDILTVRDAAPTFTEVASVSGGPDEDAEGMEGRSFLGVLNGEGALAAPTGTLAWELFGKRAVRSGDWKAVLLPPPHGDGEWHLYNLAKDPRESVDLAADAPEILETLKQGWADYAADKGVILPEVEIRY